MSCAALLVSFNSKNFISQVIEALNKYEPSVDIYIVDNHSETSETEIIPALENYLSDGVIKGYCAFHDNIIGNAFMIPFTEDIFNIVGRYEHLLFSDGDIEVLSPFLDEQKSILADDKISCCSVQVDVRLWPGSDPAFPTLVCYYSQILTTKPNEHAIVKSGGWMRLYELNFFMDVVKIFNENGFRFRDGFLDRFIEMRYNTYAAVTKNSLAKELTHQNYTQEYRRKKAELTQLTHTFENHLYNHDLISDAIVRLKPSDAPEIYSIKIEKKPFLVRSSPERYNSAADHPFFKDHAPKIKRAIIVQSGFCSDVFISALDPEISLIIIVGAKLSKVVFDSKFKIWLITSNLLLLPKQEGSSALLSLDRIDVDFRLFSTDNSKFLKQIFEFSNHNISKKGVLKVIIHNYEEIFASMSVANRKMRHHHFEGIIDGDIRKIYKARKKFLIKCSSWIATDMVACSLLAYENSLHLLEVQEGVDSESWLPYLIANFGAYHPKDLSVRDALIEGLQMVSN